MRTHRTTHAEAHGTRHRRGTAQMELTLFLPVYVAMMMILSTIFSFAETRTQVAVETRHAAWMKRDRYGSETEELSLPASGVQPLGRILNGEQSPTLGLVSASRRDNASVYLKTLNLLTDIQMEHAVLTDPWDYRVLPFEEQSRHPRLQLGERVVVFGGVDRGAMASLASVTAGFSSQAANLNSSLQNRRDQAAARIEQAKQTVSRAISETKRAIASLTSELREQRNVIPPNQPAIDELEDKLDAAESALRKLIQQMSHLQSALDFVQ